MERQDHAYVKLENVSKVYGSGEVKIVAVDHISFEINKGEFVVVVGPSGAGKTTVLNILGGMDKATSGHVLVDGVDIACKLRSNGMPVPLLRNGYSIFNGTKYR